MHTPDLIDMVNDTLSGNDYQKEEDPRQYVSQKTGRGPLAEDWIHNPPDGVIMCSYKLIKVGVACKGDMLVGVACKGDMLVGVACKGDCWWVWLTRGTCWWV